MLLMVCLVAASWCFACVALVWLFGGYLGIVTLVVLAVPGV